MFKLKREYPEVPNSLIELLQCADGTYGCQHQEHKVGIYFLGSDIEDGQYPYYLLSASQIIEREKKGYTSDFLFELIEWEKEKQESGDTDIIVDKRITNGINKVKWLNFSDCMNNGGTSSLYIDFTPSEFGKKVK